METYGLLNNNTGLLHGLSEGIRGGLEAFRAERDRKDRLRHQEDQMGLLRQKLEQGDLAKQKENASVDSLMQQLYPGDFKPGMLKDLSTGTISNVFKVQRQREGIKGREDLEKVRNQNKPPKMGGIGLLNQGRSPQEEGAGGQLLGTDKSQWMGLPTQGWDLKAVERYQKELLKHQGKLTNVIQAADNIDSFADLAKTNPTSAAALPVMLARASNDTGVLSNQDMSRWGGSQALYARLNRAAQKMAVGTLPDEDIKFIKEVAIAMGNNAKATMGKIEQDITDKYSVNYGGRPEQNYQLITGHRKTMSPTAAAPKKFYSPSRNQTKLVYPDGKEEILDGKR